jgi:hypothetical protein
MRPETKKLIEELQNEDSGTTNPKYYNLLVSDLQQIIDSETSPLEEEIEKLQDLAKKYKEEKEQFENVGNAYSAGRAAAKTEFETEIEIWKERLQAEKDMNDIIRLRDEFAMRAPVNIPNWFYSQAETYEQRFFKWRYHYADEMLKQRDDQKSVVDRLQDFISNCEDIPEDIHKVINEKFFDLIG